MHLDSLSFVYGFLPMSILLFYLTPLHWKKPMLLGISLLYYYLADPKYLLMMVASLLADFLLMQWMKFRDGQEEKRELLFYVAMGKDLGLLAFVCLNTWRDFSRLPLGFVIYTLTSLGLLIDAYRREIPYEDSCLDYLLFCSFFGKLYAGPLVRYQDLMPKLKELRPSLSAIGSGVVLFVGGLAKKVILADSAMTLYNTVSAIPVGEQSVLTSWTCMAALAFSVFFTLFAFSDMARGLARIFSLDLPKNFYYPYQSPTLREFLQRFNMTLCAYLEHYIGPPLEHPAGEEEHFDPRRSARHLLMVLLMGAWFGLEARYLLWGLFLGCMIFLEEHIFGKFLRSVPSLFRRGLTFLLILLSFSIFAGGSLEQGLCLVGNMLGLGGHALYDDSILYLLTSNWMVLLGCFALSTSVFDQIGRVLHKFCAPLADLFSVLFNTALLAVITALLL